jgi:DNA-binding NtrC family response regulator
MSTKRTVKKRKPKNMAERYEIGLKVPDESDAGLAHFVRPLTLDDLLEIEVFKDAIAEFERIYLAHRLHANNLNKHQTANQMQYDRTALYKKLKKLNMDNFF